jgi:nitrous oxidase accessory protein
MKWLLFGVLGMGMLSLPAATWHVGPGQPVAHLREALALAQAGDTVRVWGGYYTGGTFVIDKPLVLIGENRPVLDGEGQHEVMMVTASDVVISGFEVRNSGVRSTLDIAGIKVLEASRVRIEDNIVCNCNFGIYLSNTRCCLVRANTVEGTPAEEQNTGNGIHVWKADSNRIEDNALSGHRDGIYFEFVNRSSISGNISRDNIRYGLHFMFSHENRYAQNYFEYNGAGVAVMYSHGVEMYQNHFAHNWGAAAYGLLLKDITDSRITGNIFEDNTAGIYMEGASRMEVLQNQFRANGWAFRIQASCDANLIEDNVFLANSFDVATNGHVSLNTFRQNYWDKYDGYDLDRDGWGDVPYRPVSLYAMIVERMPHALMMMRSFMVYLMDRAERLLPALIPDRLVDTQPRMSRPSTF